MTKSHLRACPTCARHVRVSEAECPFCKSTLAQAFRAAPAPRPPGARLTRAALFAFGTGAAALTAGCSSSSSSQPSDAGPPIVDAAYGGPPFDDAQPEPAYGSPPIVDAAYGAPPFEAGPGPDSSAPDGGADAADAVAPQDGNFVADAAYGGPPLDSGHD